MDLVRASYWVVITIPLKLQKLPWGISHMMGGVHPSPWRVQSANITAHRLELESAALPGSVILRRRASVPTSNLPRWIIFIKHLCGWWRWKHANENKTNPKISCCKLDVPQKNRPKFQGPFRTKRTSRFCVNTWPPQGGPRGPCGPKPVRTSRLSISWCRPSKEMHWCLRVVSVALSVSGTWGYRDAN